MSLDCFWLQSYLKGVFVEIDVNEFYLVVLVFDVFVVKFCDCFVYFSFGKVFIYGEIDVLVNQFVVYLLGEFKFKKGDCVVLMMFNCLQYLVVIFGVLCVGLIVVNVNLLYILCEFKYQLVDVGVIVLVVVDNFGDIVEQVIVDMLVKYVVIIGLGDLFGVKGVIVNFVLKYIKKMVFNYYFKGVVCFCQVFKIGSCYSLFKVEIDYDDIVFLQYIGGIIGVVKGVMLINCNLIVNMQQVLVWISVLGIEMGKEWIIIVLLLYYIFVLIVNGLVFMKFGGCNYLIINSWDMKGFVKEFKLVCFIVIIGVNMLFNGLFNIFGFDMVDFFLLKVILGGGMVVQCVVVECWKKVIGVILVEVYGLIEILLVVCINLFILIEYNGLIGLLILFIDVCIKDDNSVILLLGEVGEFCIKGLQVMKGYWQCLEEIVKVIDVDGWLYIGDMVKMDEYGFFYIVDCKKDMILVFGFNVYLNEVEDVIVMMLGVLEVVVVGVLDDKFGEVVKVVIVKKDLNLIVEMVKEYVWVNLIGYKYFKIVEF